jgi:hypothetical protein
MPPMTLLLPPALGELLALLLAGFALLGSELVGVGCSRRADRLALLLLRGGIPPNSECELLGGDTEWPLGGGVTVDEGPWCGGPSGGSDVGPLRGPLSCGSTRGASLGDDWCCGPGESRGGILG